jgi:AcrR family transcriptional regulator
MGVQKGSLYSLTDSKQELLYETMREGASAFHAGLDAIPDDAGAAERIRLALRAHLRVVAEQLDMATVFIREWRYLEGGAPRGDRRRAAALRGARARALPRGPRARRASHRPRRRRRALLVLSAANWAYTWLTPGRDTDALADSFAAILVDGIRGYSMP